MWVQLLKVILLFIPITCERCQLCSLSTQFPGLGKKPLTLILLGQLCWQTLHYKISSKTSMQFQKFGCNGQGQWLSGLSSQFSHLWSESRHLYWTDSTNCNCKKKPYQKEYPPMTGFASLTTLGQKRGCQEKEDFDEETTRITTFEFVMVMTFKKKLWAHDSPSLRCCWKV